MASFDGSTFLEASQDGYPSWDKRMIVTDRQVANGEADTLDVGLDIQKAGIKAIVTRTELEALYSKCGESGSLVMDSGTDIAYLDDITPPLLTHPGDDQLEVVLHFIKL